MRNLQQPVGTVLMSPSVDSLPLMSEHLPTFLWNVRRPRWPSGKVPALEPEGSKPDSTEDLSCTLNQTQGVKRPPAGVVRKFGEGCQLRCRLYTVIQNYEVRPKIALMLL
uniref:Uncharacterized protein n=1 Tax=Araneus ventricosus TaxID=182803 RepID=A0A4Y2ENC0_ARAVE|nr:hypothetical protein AVEN_269452-1 [Araneus ventricosus]